MLLRSHLFPFFFWLRYLLKFNSLQKLPFSFLSFIIFFAPQTPTFAKYAWLQKQFFRQPYLQSKAISPLNHIKKFSLFLINFFYYKGKILLFVPIFFQTFSYAWNWVFFKNFFFFWSYYKFFFTQKTLFFNKLLFNFFSFLKISVTFFIFITNPVYHKQLIQFSHLFNLFSFGPIASHIPFWLLSWPLVTINATPSNQFFLIHIFFMFRRRALLL